MLGLITLTNSSLLRDLQMERFNIQVKLLEEHSRSLNSSFLKDFNRTAREILSTQSGINHRTSGLHSDFMICLSELSADLQDLNKHGAELQSACVAVTSLTLGIQENQITDVNSLEQELDSRVKALDELEARSCEARRSFQLREECLSEQLAHLKEMRELQKNRLKGELDSSYRSALQSLKRLRSEFEEAYTCEEVATSLAIETERRAAEKCHTACKKMFQSAENRIRRMEAVRRKRLAAFRQTLDELNEQIGRPQTSSSDEDPSDHLLSVLSAIGCGDDVNLQLIPTETNLPESRAMLRDPLLMESGQTAAIESGAPHRHAESGCNAPREEHEAISDLGSEVSGSDHCSTPPLCPNPSP